MKTNRMLGLPIALAGLALVVTSFEINSMLVSTQSTGAPSSAIQLGNVVVPFVTATTLGLWFFVAGVALMNIGVAVRLLGRAPRS